MGSSASAYFWVRSSSVETSRAVAATLSPRSSAAIAHSRPKPRDVPVMNQTFPLMWVTNRWPRSHSRIKQLHRYRRAREPGVAGQGPARSGVDVRRRRAPLPDEHRALTRPGPVLATGHALGAADRPRRQGARPGRGYGGVDGGARGVGAWVWPPTSRSACSPRAPPGRCPRSPVTRPGCRSPTGCSTRSRSASGSAMSSITAPRCRKWRG